MSPTAKLAMFGGERAVPRDRSRVEWPIVDESDRAAMLRALDSGALVSNAEGEREVVGLEREFAERHGLALVEDAAQAHGATYGGKAAGSLADLGCFSLNATKNLPTCGEGGLVTTDDPELGRGVAMRRQFGEDIDESRGRS